jgi:hypothetical protein
MTIYWIGYIVIPLGLFFFIFSPSRLYALTVFSIAFTGTAVFEITAGPFEIRGIRPTMVLGALCILRYAITAIVKGKIEINSAMRPPFFWLLAFALIASLSLVMPFIINGDLQVLDAYSKLLTYADPKPLVFSFQYVTQLMYLLLGCVLAYYFAVVNRSAEDLTRTIRIYLYSTWFLCFWALLELALFYLPGEYPAFLFNQNSMSSQGTLTLNGFPRITSVSLEPSIMSQQLFTALPLVFWAWWGKDNYLRMFELRVLLALIVVVCLMSTSSTAVFGIAFFALMVVAKWLLSKKIRVSAALLLLVAFAGFVIVTPIIIGQIQEKLFSYSGEERLMAIRYGWEYFSQYPILGIGWGVFPSWDVVVCILTACGILGFGMFLMMTLSINKNINVLKRSGSFTTLQLSVWHSFLLLLIVSQVSGLIYYSQYFWLILGLAIAASSLRNDTTESREQ